MGFLPNKRKVCPVILSLKVSYFYYQAVEHVGLAAQGKGGAFWENIYNKYADEATRKAKPLNINTHGGLMHFGAPGSATALCMYYKNCIVRLF